MPWLFTILVGIGLILITAGAVVAYIFLLNKKKKAIVPEADIE